MDKNSWIFFAECIIGTTLLWQADVSQCNNFVLTGLDLHEEHYVVTHCAQIETNVHTHQAMQSVCSVVISNSAKSISFHKSSHCEQIIIQPVR